MGLREKLYFNLCEKKIMTTALYHTLIPEITSEKFPISHFVSQNILNLPIHQEVEQKDLKLLVREIKIFEEKYKKGELDVL
jgi:dTDP-4-amino-4,6-dideoxygalactose transaminase